MIEITFELTRRCNYDCAHCLRDMTAAEDLPLPLFDQILAQASEYGIRKVGLTGGEPTLHRQFSEALDLLVHHGLQYHFVTNGSTFPHVLPQLLAESRREALQFVVFSLEGGCAEVNDKIRGAGSFNAVMRGISLCHVQKIRFGIALTIGRHNREAIDQVTLLAGHLGAEFITFDHMHPTPQNSRQHLPLLLSEWRRVEQDVIRIGDAVTVKVAPCVSMYNPDPLYVCPSMAGVNLHVDFLGNLVFCCSLSGYRGEGPPNAPRTEVIAHLGSTSLFDAHRMLLDKTRELSLARLARVEAGTLREADYFPCLTCHRHFGQLDWTDDY